MAEFDETHGEGKTLHYEGYVYTMIRDGKDKAIAKMRKHATGSTIVTTRWGIYS